MKHHSKLRITATTFCCVLVALFFFLFTYMFFFENVSVYSARHAHTYTTLDDYSVTQVEDKSAPIGIRTEYHMILEDFDSSESCMCFYLVHHYADVYLEGELIHSLHASEHNKIGETISSNWVTIPIHEEDSGKELTIVLTPLFKNMVDFEPEFLVGSHFSIVLDQFKEDIPQLFIALLCMIMGILILTTYLYFICHTNIKSWDMLYLAGFAVLLGLWRITDMKMAPILFSRNPMVLGYISIGSLFLCSIFLHLYISSFFHKKRANQLLVVTMICTAVTFMVWLFQIFGITEFKEMLSLSHIMLIIAIADVLIFSIFSKKGETSKKFIKHSKLFLILAIGIALDIVWFYLHNSSSHVIYTVSAFVIYTLVVFVTSILDTTKKAQLDSPTGLINKSRWNELMSHLHLDEEIISIAMIDLNGLKQINDTFGHEIGDKMIFEFSKILKSSFPSDSVICRWGGDEFAIMIENINAEKIGQYIETLQNSVAAHNSNPDNLQLSYAVGYCLSTEYPKADHAELLSIADSRMYADKKGK